MGFLFFKTNWDKKIRKLRISWDRARELALKKGGLYKKNTLLKLDQIEQNLRLLEERELGKVERARIAKEVEINLSEIKAILAMKKEELAAYLERQRPQAKNF